MTFSPVKAKMLYFSDLEWGTGEDLVYFELL